MFGKTPLLPLDGQLFLKLEGCNPSGSLRDRAVFPMIAAGDQENRTLLLADWGPFALSAAWTAATLQRKLELWLPYDADNAFTKQLERFHVPIHRVKLTLQELQKQIRELAELRPEQYQLLDPAMDPEHPMAYCETLSQEIWEQTDGTLAAIVSGTDTCACLMGCATTLKQRKPDILSVAAPISQDFYGNSDPLGPVDPEFYVPQLCDVLSYCSLQEAKEAQRELVQRTGLPCGLVGGAAYYAAKALKKESNGRIVAILPSRYDCF